LSPASHSSSSHERLLVNIPVSTVLPSLARILTLLCPYLLPSTVGSWYGVAELSAGQRIDRPCKATQVASGLCAGVKVQKVKML